MFAAAPLFCISLHLLQRTGFTKVVFAPGGDRRAALLPRLSTGEAGKGQTVIISILVLGLAALTILIVRVPALELCVKLGLLLLIPILYSIQCIALMGSS